MAIIRSNVNEIKNKRVVKLIPGYEESSGDYKAYDLQNTVILGTIGSGVSCITDSLIYNLVSTYSPNEVSIQLFPLQIEGNPWLSSNRHLPHFTNQPELSDVNYFEVIKYHLLDCLRAVVDKSPREDLNTKHNIIIIEYSRKFKDYPIVMKIIELLLRAAMNDDYTHVIISSDLNNFELLEWEPYFGLRILTRTEELISNTFLGCNLSSREKATNGFAWITSKDDFYVKRRVTTVYRPDSLYRKLAKHLSSDYKVQDDAYGIKWKRVYDADCYMNTLYVDTLNMCCTPVDDESAIRKELDKLDVDGLCNKYVESVEDYAKIVIV